MFFAPRHITPILLLFAMVLSGCPTDPPEPEKPDPVRTFIIALPTSQNMAVDVPGVPLSDIGNLDFASGLADVPMDEHAALRKLVLHSVKDADRGLNLFLEPLREITSAVEEPEILQEDPVRAIWRYTRPDDSGLEMALVLEESLDKSLSFILSERNPNAPNAEWRVRTFGTYTPWATPPDGHGSAWVDLRDQGKVLIIWTRNGGSREFTIHHHSVTKDALGPESIDAIEPQQVTETLTFNYSSQDTGEGSFTFGPKYIDIYTPTDESKPIEPVPTPKEERDADKNDPKPDDSSPIDTVALDAQENLNVMVRWNKMGAGRIDATAKGPNIKQSNFKLGRLAECWAQETYERSYLYYELLGKSDAQHEVFAKDGDPVDCPYLDSLEILLPILGKIADNPPVPVEVKSPAENPAE